MPGVKGAFRSGMTTNELVAKWWEIQREHSRDGTDGGRIYQRRSEEVKVLRLLLQAGCSNIPGECLSVEEALEERQELLRSMQDSVAI